MSSRQEACEFHNYHPNFEPSIDVGRQRPKQASFVESQRSVLEGEEFGQPSCCLVELPEHTPPRRTKEVHQPRLSSIAEF
jgi:hypothetical protein